MDKDFLLSTPTAQHLFHDYAAKMPILDYHCHINPREIAEDRKFENITQVWLGGDHYKWRQMRTNGVDEKYITGDASDREKFQKWAETLEMAIGNPLYHWRKLLRNRAGQTGQHRNKNRMIRIIRKSRLRMTEHIKKEILIKLVKLNEEIYSEIHLKERRYDYETYFKAD